MVLAPRVPEALYVHKPQFAMEMYGKYFIDRITDGRFITHRNRIVVYCACCVPALRDVGKLANVFHNAKMSFVIMICVTMSYLDMFIQFACFCLPVCLIQRMYVCVSYVHSMLMLPLGRTVHTPQRS